MANYNVTIYTDPGEPGLPSALYFSPRQVNVAIGDTVTYTVSSFGFSVNISYLSSGISSTKPVGSSISPGQSFTVTALTAGTKTVSCSFSSTTGSGDIVVNASDPDPTPTPFSFTAVTEADLDTFQYSNIITLQDINVPVRVSASGGGAVSVNGGGYSTSELVANEGDTLRVRLRSSSGYDTSISTTISVKYSSITKYSTTWSVLTEGPPDINTYPQTAVGSLPLSMNRLKQVFGKLSSSFSIKDYYRGGTLVPNLTVNSGIPTSGTIRLSDFVGTANALYWLQEPIKKYSNASLPDNKGQKFYFTWNAGTHYYAGHSQYVSDYLEYRVTVDSSESYGFPGVVTAVIPNPNAFSVANKDLKLEWQIPNTNTGNGDGVITLKVEARAEGTTSPVITTYAVLAYTLAGENEIPE